MKSCAVCLMVLTTLSLTALAGPIRTLPPPPGPIQDLRANATGDLYVRTATNVVWMDLRNPAEGWNALELGEVVDLSENAGREVFARKDMKTRFAIHRLVGGEAKPVTTAPNAPCEQWYVDALGRAWLQNRERLLVVGREETLLDRPARWGGFNLIRQPCEWRAGHVVLLYGAEAVYATPEQFTVEAAPLFSGDASGAGPFRLGQQHLLGGYNRKSNRVSSCRFDPGKPGQPPEPLQLGWDWFYGVSTAPDGRLLVLEQTDRNPQFTLFWYAADGQSEVRMKGAEDIIRAGSDPRAILKARVVFASNSVGFATTPNGMLAVLRPDAAALVTPALGLPIPRVEHLAALGNDLVMAGGGKLVAWLTTEPLRPDPAFANKLEWSLAGPCLRDRSGAMWAFLLDFPGKLSRHDGQRWHHLDIELGERNPRDMSTDDLGRLQVGSQEGASNACQLADGLPPGGMKASTRAWFGTSANGPASLSDGSPFRQRHAAPGNANGWWLDGQTFWDGERAYDYGDFPPYSYYWLGPDGTCYRGGAGRLWVYAGGRWTETHAPPMSVGPDGIIAGTGTGRLPVVYDGQPKLLLPRPAGFPESRTPRTVPLQGNEALIPGPGGGWLGLWRVFRDAHYTVAGRVYPGTNGHYLVEGNTLRFQALQTLNVEGEVLEDGKERRLACRISGAAPLYKPRLLVFLDAEFQESMASPDGGNLPPLKPGIHRIEVYAADGFGVISAQPLSFTVNGPAEYPAEELILDDAWAPKPRRLLELPAKSGDRSLLGRAMEIDAEGTVWMLVEGGVVSLTPADRQAAFYRCPAQELLAARGRVWARAERSPDGVRIALLELRRDGVRRAVELYDDSSYAHQQIWADGAGGIWALSHRAATRWDGTATQTWGRPVGYDAVLIPSRDGAVIHTRSHGYLVYRDGELSQPVPWSGDFKDRWQQADRIVFPLGRGFLVLPLQRLLLDLDSGRPSDKKIPFGETYRQGVDGSLFVWKGPECYRISGDDLTVSPPEKALRPGMEPLWDPGGYEFLATAGRTVVYTVRDSTLVAWRPGESAVEYGWQQGIQPGRTAAIREAPDGRIWIMRAAQLLLYDPAQPADTIPSAWPGWRAVPIQECFAAGAFGRVWFGNPERNAFTSSDGTNELKWAQRYPGANAIIVSDNGAAAIGAGTDTYLVSTGKPPQRVQDLHSAVLELVKRGAKAFEGDGAPAVAADGRVYFGGRIWDGQAWQSAPDGRPSLDMRGELYLVCMERSSLPVAYRFDGVKAVPLGQVEKCLIDAYGLRWFDEGLLEAKPGCMPVLYASKDAPEVAFDMNALRVRIDPHGSLQALPLGDGQFLLRIGARLHRLDARGLTRIPGSAVPCGDELDPGWGLRVWPLAAGRWALAVHSRLYFSPPDFGFGRLSLPADRPATGRAP